MLRRIFPFFLLLQSVHIFAQPQPPKREFRGAWIATVKNIDWPSEALMPGDLQQEELTDLLDTLEAHHLNAVIFQVRPSGEVFYPSANEPWSQWVSGKQGKAPDPYYDPLEFAIAESHRRGMEFHAWFNPFRADLDWDSSKVLAPTHLSNKHPDWCVQYGKNLYLDPGWPEARTYIVEQVLEVVRRYPIDAIHFDDYFYPYQLPGKDFPDSSSFAQWGSPMADRGDWRRDNINQFIKVLRDSLLALAPSVQFGVSPFGVWRNQRDDPRGSATLAGQTSYDALYADVRLWLEKGWIDYVIPQAYFSIGYRAADFSELLRWWSENSFGKRVYLGHSPYKIGNNSDPNWDDPSQVNRQVALVHQNGQVQGSSWFSSRWFELNPLGFSDSLVKVHYPTPVLLPELPYLSEGKPSKPQRLSSRATRGGILLNWDEPSGEVYPLQYAVYRRKGKISPNSESKYLIKILSSNEKGWLDSKVKFFKKYTYQISALGPGYVESSPSAPRPQRYWVWAGKK